MFLTEIALAVTYFVVLPLSIAAGWYMGKAQTAREFRGYLDTYTSQYNQPASPEQAAREG